MSTRVFRVRTVAALVSAALIAGFAPARAASAAAPLTLDRCVEIALDNHPTLHAAERRTEAAAEAVGEARASFYPSVDAAAGWSRWERHAFLPSGLTDAGHTDVIGPTDDWFAGLQARMTLFDGGERRAHATAAAARRDAAGQEAEGVRQAVALEVHRAYYTLLAAEEGRSVASRNLVRTVGHLRLAEQRKAAGAVSQADVLRAQVDVADAKLTLVSAESLVRIARGRLNTAMGLPVETDAEVVPAAPPLEPPSEEALRAALERSESGRPEIGAALQRMEAARHDLEAARSAYRPRITADAGFGWRDSTFPPEDRDWAVGLTVRLPVFDGHARKHRVARANAVLAQERAQADGLRSGIRQEVWTAHARWVEAFRAMEAALVQVRDAEESLRTSELRYEAGAATLTDLLDARTAAARADGKLVEVRWSYHLAESEFRWASGDPLAGGTSHEAL